MHGRTILHCSAAAQDLTLPQLEAVLASAPLFWLQETAWPCLGCRGLGRGGGADLVGPSCSRVACEARGEIPRGGRAEVSSGAANASKVEIMDRCLKKAWRERQKALPRAKCEFGGAVCETDSRRGLLQSWRSVLCSPLFALRGQELAGSRAWGRCHDTGGHMRPSQDHQIPKGVPIMPRPERPKRARAILDRVEGRQNSVLPGCQAAQQPSSPARQV